MLKLCKDCKFVRAPGDEYTLYCVNEKVVSKDYCTLSRKEFKGTDCTSARQNRFFKPCGIKGKLWEKA